MNDISRIPRDMVAGAFELAHNWDQRADTISRQLTDPLSRLGLMNQTRLRARATTLLNCASELRHLISDTQGD